MIHFANKRFIFSLLLTLLVLMILPVGCARAADNLDEAYRIAVSEAGPTTSALVESLDLSEFQDHFGITMTAEEEKLVRLALMTYSNGSILMHPVGINSVVYASIQDDPYVGNKNSKKFHHSWCSSVADIKEKNKVTFRSREEAVSAGYKPCKRCNP